MATIRNLMLKLGLDVDTDGATRGLGKLEGLVQKTSSIVGIAGGVALGAGLVQALDLSASRGKIAAQLGVTASESKRIGDVAGKLFANAYGDSMDDVNGAVTSVIRNMDGMRTASSSSLEQTTARALTLSQVMGEDVGKVTESVSQLMRTGLAKNSKEAFDILTRGAQLGADKSHDLLDSIVEYPIEFKKLGINAEVAMGLINQGLQSGARNADVVSDALKEFAIRAVDGTALTAQGFKMLGLSGQDMAQKLSRGGKTAADAFDLTLKRLRAIPDPVMRSQAAVALFGTKAEDLGDALYALDPSTAVKGLGLVAGAADRAGKALGETAASRMESFKRSVQQNVVSALDTVISGFTRLPRFVQDGLTQFATLATVIGPVIYALVKARSAMIAFAATSVVSAGISKLTSLWDTLRLKVMYAAESFGNASGPVGKFKTALGGITGIASKAKSAISGAVGLLGGPWGLALTGGIAAITLFANRNNEAEANVRDFTDAIKDDSGVLGENTRARVVNKLETDGMLKSAEKLGINVRRFTDAALGQKDALAEVSNQLHGVTQNVTTYGGRAGQGALATKTMTAEAQGLLSALTGTNGELGQSVASFKRTSGAMGTTAKATDAVVDGNHEIAASASVAAIRTEYLSRKLHFFNNEAADATLANIQFKETLNNLTNSITKNNNGISKRTGLFNLNTQKGRDNTRMVIDAIKAAKDHSDKLLKEGKSADSVTKSYDKKIVSLRGVLEKMGLSRTSIDKLINKYAEAAKKINNATGGIKDRKVKIHVSADGTVSLPGGTKASIFKSGGVLPGYTPGRDVHYFHSPNGQTLGLSGGEAVMRPEFTKGVGKPWVDEMNYIARTGGVNAVRKTLGPSGSSGPGNKRLGGEGMFFSGGGIISEGDVSGLGNVQAMTKKYNAKVGSWTWNAAQKVVKKLNALGVGGPKVQKALTWAKKQAGKPYLWAGVGPNSWDCSGFMGSLWAIIKGKPPYRRYFSTRSFGASSGPGGFVRNLNSGFKVGVSNAGVGHMAGTLGKTNVESSGSHGVRVGGGARGYNNGMFGYRYGLRMDNGGILPPHSVTPVYNGTSKPEYAIPSRYMSDGGGDTINITIHAGVGTDVRELERVVFNAIKKYKGRNGRNLTV